MTHTGQKKKNRSRPQRGSLYPLCFWRLLLSYPLLRAISWISVIPVTLGCVPGPPHIRRAVVWENQSVAPKAPQRSDKRGLAWWPLRRTIKCCLVDYYRRKMHYKLGDKPLRHNTDPMVEPARSSKTP